MKRDKKRERRRIPHHRWTNMFQNPISKISGQFIAWLRRICTVFSAIWPIPRGKCFLDPILSKTIYNLAKSWAIFTTIGLKLQSPIGKGRKSITRFGPSLPGLAPVRLVACRAAGVVTCSRLVVCKIRPWARGPVPVRLLATHAYPASDGWHDRFKFSWLSTEAQRDKSCGEADHGYDTQRDPWHRHSPDAKRAAGPHQY